MTRAELRVAPRLFALGLIYLVVAAGLIYVTPSQLVHLHTAFDTAAVILTGIAASQLVEIARRRSSSLALFGAIVLFASAAAEAVHLLTIIAWNHDTPFLQKPVQSLRPLTWSPAGYVLALGLLAALVLTRRRRILAWGWFVLALVLILLAPVSLFSVVFPLAGGWGQRIWRPGLLCVAAAWSVLTWLGIRSKRGERLEFVLGAGALLFLAGNACMLFSGTPADPMALLAHLGKVLGLVFFILTFSRMDALDARRVVEAEGKLRERTAHLDRTVNELEASIGALKRSQEALRESDERGRVVLDSLTEGVMFFNASGVLESANHAAQQMTGRSFEELNHNSDERRPAIALVRKDGTRFPEGGEPSMLTLRTGKAVRDVEVGIYRTDGTLRWHSVNSEPVHNSSGKLLGVVSSFFDITERKRAEEELHAANESLAHALEASRIARTAADESQQRLKLALDTAQIGEWDLDMRTGTATRSRRYDQIFGQAEAPPKWHCDDFLQFVHPDERDRAGELFRAGVANGQWNFECRILRADGALRWIWSRGGVLKDSAGQPVRMVGMAADITETKVAEQALRESQAMTQTIVENALDAVVSIDQHGGILGWNSRAEGMFGWSKTEAIGRAAADLMVPEAHRETFSRGLRESLQAGNMPSRGERIELDVMNRDGEVFPAEMSISLLASAGRTIFSIFIRDIRERRRAEHEIRELTTQLEQRVQKRTRELEEANRELESFSYSVSHDLRAPLRHVQGFVELLRRNSEGQLSDKCRRYLDTISDASREMGVLIDDLLSFSRMGRSEMRDEPVDLNELTRECLARFETALRGREVAWTIPELPAVRGDRAMLKQVLVNLLDNAIKYTRPRDRAEIHVGCAGVEDGRATFFVRDNGVGFDPAYAHKLFGVFQRLHRPEEFEGTGIGLANIRRIVGRHGGRTWAEGQVDQGATVFFSLQANAEDEFAERQAAWN